MIDRVVHLGFEVRVELTLDNDRHAAIVTQPRLRTMRAPSLLTMAVLAALAIPGGAVAADREVEAFSYGYRAGYVKVDPGDTVTWRMGAGGESHTVTTRGRVPQRFDSGVKDTGETFAFTFRRPGRYEYYCELHTGLMFGSVQVGPDTTPPELTRLRAKPRRTRVGVSVTSSEDAKLAVTLAPAARPRRVRSRAATRRFRDGSAALVLPRPAAGRYTVTVTATDREANVSKRMKVAFSVPKRR